MIPIIIIVDDSVTALGVKDKFLIFGNDFIAG